MSLGTGFIIVIVILIFLLILGRPEQD